MIKYYNKIASDSEAHLHAGQVPKPSTSSTQHAVEPGLRQVEPSLQRPFGWQGHSRKPSTWYNGGLVGLSCRLFLHNQGGQVLVGSRLQQLFRPTLQCVPSLQISLPQQGHSNRAGNKRPFLRPSWGDLSALASIVVARRTAINAIAMNVNVMVVDNRNFCCQKK